MISEIAGVLKLNVEQLAILKGNYLPQGWLDEDWEQRLVRRHLLSVLSGRSAILIRPDPGATEQGPYPAQPEIDAE